MSLRHQIKHQFVLFLGGHPFAVPTTPQFIRRREAQCASEKKQESLISMPESHVSAPVS